MTRKLRQRQRLHLAQMKQQMDAPNDGGEVQPPQPTPPIIDPHSAIPRTPPRAPKTTDHSQPLWFAIWSANRNLACALKTSPEEITLCQQSLRSAQRAWGDNFAGPFSSQQQAENLAVEKLIAALSQR